MSKSLFTKIITLATTKGDITCYVSPCIGYSLTGKSSEYYCTRYEVSEKGKRIDAYDKSIWMYEGIDAKGRTLKVGSRGFPLEALLPQLDFSSPAKAKATKAIIKAGMEKVILANKWNVVDSQS
jgi:hypothetical protein